jgi:hypothetical protein
MIILCLFDERANFLSKGIKVILIFEYNKVFFCEQSLLRFKEATIF